MKTTNSILAAFSITLLISSGASAQYDESIFVNGMEIYLQKNHELELKSGLACHAEGKTYLTWIAANLQAEGSFIIYRSSDGENYEIIGIAQTEYLAGKTNIGYHFIDNHPIQFAPSYYKITYLGNDGTFSTSGVISLRSVATIFSSSMK